MMKILVDRNIERNAITHESTPKPRSLRWGDHDLTLDVLTRQKVLLREDEIFRREQLPYLATVTELAREGQLRLFTSFELMNERVRQRGRDRGYLGLNILEGISIQNVCSQVGRTIVIDSCGRNIGVTKEKQIEFFKSITDSRFLAIRGAAGDAHIADAFHLWTAETNALDAFLSMDRRFLNVMNNQGRKVNSPVMVSSPKCICESLGNGPTDIEELAARYHPFR